MSQAVSAQRLSQLQARARTLRRHIITSTTAAGSGHPTSSLSAVEIATALYFGDVLRHDPKKPDWPERDYLILSNGHIVPVRYAAMAHAGYFSVEEAETTLRKFGSRLQGHPERGRLPGLETTSGPLGEGHRSAAARAGAMSSSLRASSGTNTASKRARLSVATAARSSGQGKVGLSESIKQSEL